jgi:acetolactate synthase-1/2/3 large subunit
MDGAHAVVSTLARSGVSVCFTNPGTSEMPLVAALDDVGDVRGVLCLFEGVASGAADGYARMAERPAATLFHLGPGLANALANLHNARRARSPVVNLVGDHATYHKRFDAPLDSDLAALAGVESGFLRRSERSADAGADAADAVAAARTPPGQVATLLLPSDACWAEGGEVAAPRPVRARSPVPEAALEEAAEALHAGDEAVLLLGGPALREPGLAAAARIAAATGARILTETHMARVERGGGRPAFDRLGYFAETALAQLEGARHLVLAGATAPVAFFAYPGRPSSLVPDHCALHVLAEPAEDVVGALQALAELVGSPAATGRTGPTDAREAGHARHLRDPGAAPGLGELAGSSEPLHPTNLCSAIAAALPEGAVLVDEAITASLALAEATTHAPPHDLLCHVGGAIGQGLPLATGAALACPGRRVVCVEGDGSALYTIQALWTQAREGLDVTSVIVANRAYAILQIEMHRMRPEAPVGSLAASLLGLGSPAIDFAAVARGFGVPAVTVATLGELAKALERSLSEPGPSLIEAVVAPR